MLCISYIINDIKDKLLTLSFSDYDFFCSFYPKLAPSIFSVRRLLYLSFSLVFFLLCYILLTGGFTVVVLLNCHSYCEVFFCFFLLELSSFFFFPLPSVHFSFQLFQQHKKHCSNKQNKLAFEQMKQMRNKSKMKIALFEQHGKSRRK